MADGEPRLNEIAPWRIFGFFCAPRHSSNHDLVSTKITSRLTSAKDDLTDHEEDL